MGLSLVFTRGARFLLKKLTNIACNAFNQQDDTKGLFTVDSWAWVDSGWEMERATDGNEPQAWNDVELKPLDFNVAGVIIILIHLKSEKILLENALNRSQTTAS